MKFRKKPVVIEATQWFKNGDHPDDFKGLDVDSSCSADILPEGTVVRRFRLPYIPESGDEKCKHCSGRLLRHGWVNTLEGGHIVCPGDWIITGVKGEHYPCKPDVFAATYEPADAPVERRAEAPALAFIRSEAERTKGKGRLGEFWAECLTHAEQIQFERDFDAARATVAPLVKRALEAESIPSEIWNLHFKSTAPSLAPGAAQPVTQEHDLTAEEIAELRLDFIRWLRQRPHWRDMSPEVLALVLPAMTEAEIAELNAAQPDSRPTAGAAPSVMLTQELFGANHEALSDVPYIPPASMWDSLREALCNVSQIFNGWRGDECWSKWDEEVSQEVVELQRTLDNRNKFPSALRASASSPARPTAAQGATAKPLTLQDIQRTCELSTSQAMRVQVLIRRREEQLRAAQGGSVSPEVLEKLDALISRVQKDAQAELDEAARYGAHSLNAKKLDVAESAARSEALHRTIAQVHHWYLCELKDIRALLVPAAGTPANGHPQEPK